VGFLKYYEVKQIPNFLLASPVIFLSSWGILYYFRHFRLFQSTSSRESRATEPYHDVMALPFIVYWAVLLVIGVLFVHVQVLTRFLSACPPLYWFCASFYDDASSQELSKEHPKWNAGMVRWAMQHLIAFYFLAYTLVGILLFCNFYPWT